ncbi:RNA polymerase sigma factor [Fulvivirgaceae bacterium BMA12]|uniref:RNA polymerase sigma factor n=1 Tax=Agaribacillus aureus TaxID=3051825 RepID=A0ABT8L2A8_9BACT|nr:RNA polymerase sigma factor [Fulvivirgaceae bacterium BMA12]
MSSRRQKKFLSLYEPVHDRFERFCRARVFGQMEFRDLMNDTLVVAYQKFHELKSEKAFLSYLFGISIRLLSNYHKKKREVDHLSDLDLPELSSNCHTDSDAEISLLHQALSRLPEEQKESIILFEITGFSIREIAALHQVSESAVKQRLVRGRKRLARMLMQVPSQKDKTS